MVNDFGPCGFGHYRRVFDRLKMLHAKCVCAFGVVTIRPFKRAPYSVDFTTIIMMRRFDAKTSIISENKYKV